MSSSVLQQNPPPLAAKILDRILAKVRVRGAACFQCQTYQTGYRFRVAGYLQARQRQGDASEDWEMHCLLQPVIYEALQAQRIFAPRGTGGRRSGQWHLPSLLRTSRAGIESRVGCWDPTMLVISAPRLPEGWSISAASQTETATGDIAGVRSRLSYLAQLGVDAIWINPWYRSPMADAGYDAADFRNIDPSSVTLAEAEALIEEAHRHGIKVIPDIIPNHTSDQHPWFRSRAVRCTGGP